MALLPERDPEQAGEDGAPGARPPRPIERDAPAAEQPYGGGHAHAAPEAPEDAEEQRRIARLQERLQHKPIVTWILIGAISLAFAAQVALGGAEDPTVMARMGALMRDRVLAGEWWRVVSSAFLHAGVMHFALNTYVLFIIGNTLERVIGSARFFVAYVASILGASAAAMLFSDAGLTVGASGGVFGLFGLEAVLVFARRELLPESVRARHARTVLINLGINVVNSFRPNIAMAAHFGGFVFGGLLGLLLVPRRLEAGAREPVAMQALAGLSTLLVVVSLGASVVVGRPFEVGREPTLEARSVPSLGLRLEVPEGITGPTATDSPEVTFGDPMGDGLMIGVLSERWAEPMDDASIAAELESVATELAASSPERTTLGGHPALLAQSSTDGVGIRRAFVFTPVRWVRLEVAFRESLQSGYGTLATRIAATLEEEP